ncbi:hypothetical protein AB0B15_42570 [Streptomyces sp. NPDC045456]|uniref:hypothetical protein n=1 Tax=Streptomyces sp. NPDC045456 TaxID=3155254 RepID=UPI0033D6DCC3
MPAEQERVSREEEITSVFVELADTLVAEFDVMDFLHTLTERTTRLLPVDAAGVILLDAQGRMVDATASDERTRRPPSRPPTPRSSPSAPGSANSSAR